MQSVLDYTIPEIHPLLVHFPVALLSLAFVAAIVWLISGSPNWLNTVRFMAVFGVLGAFAAFLSGRAMAEQSEGVPIVDELVGLHERLAIAVLVLASLLTVLSLAAGRRRPQGARLRRLLGFGLAVTAIATAIVVIWTGHVGGTMVWGVPAH